MPELRDLALSILESPELASKLAPLPAWTDRSPGSAVRITEPARDHALRIRPGREVVVPPVAGMPDPAQRARILCALANHELQAVELFAWAILAFPDAPPAFRRGLAQILGDEQRHCELYLARARALGSELGDHGVTGHFWGKLDAMTTPLEFVCVMGLTFENANLDFAGDYARAARAADDEATAEALDAVHADEIRHVAFAWTWLDKLRPAGSTPLEAYLQSVRFPLGPARARGRHLDVEARRACGLDEAFISALSAAEPKRPGGAPR